jgi:hypothetical protein
MPNPSSQALTPSPEDVPGIDINVPNPARVYNFPAKIISRSTG